MHIESRKSMRTNSEYEIFVNLENETGEVSAPELVRSLKRQISYIQIDPIEESIRQRKSSERGGDGQPNSIGNQTTTNGHNTNGGSVGNGMGVGGGGGINLLADDVFHTEKFIDTTNTTTVNSDGQMIRLSTIESFTLVDFNLDLFWIEKN